ncbi:MAG: MMPL family transporter [Bacteroidota bacterium]
MWQKIANLILRNRWFIIIVLFILTGFFGYFAVTGLKIDNKYGNMLPKDSAAQASYLKFKKMFGEDGSTLVIAIQSDSLYSEKTFKKWKELGDSILQFDGVENVVSEATLFTIHNNTTLSKFEAKPIFYDKTYREKSIDSIQKEIKNNPLYKDILYNDKNNVTLMMIGLDEEFLTNQKKSGVVLDIENLAKSYEKEFGKTYFAGLPHIRIIIGKRIINEMYFFIGLTILVTSLILYLFFKSLKVVMLSNIVVFVAVIWSLGSIAIFDFKISIMMALIPPLMIIIGIPNCVFLVLKFHQEVKKSKNKIKALASVITKIGFATFLTNFTEAIGFATSIFTNSEKLMEFGIIASLNIMVVFVLSITIIPILTSISKQPKAKHLNHLDTKYANLMVEKIIYLATHKRKLIYGISIGIIAISVFGITRIKATGNITGDLPKGDIILTDQQFIESNFGGSIPFEIIVNYKNQGRLFQNETMEKIDSIQRRYNKNGHFSKSLSYIDFIKVINMAYYGNNPEHYKIFSNKDKLRIKKYLKQKNSDAENFDISNTTTSNFSLKELVDTTSHSIRIRTQMKDYGSYVVADRVKVMRREVDLILNPEKPLIEKHYAQVLKGKKNYIDSILLNNPGVYNNLTEILSKGNAETQNSFDLDAEKIKSYYTKNSFNKDLRLAIDDKYFTTTFTGTSVIASQGTLYLVNSLTSSILFAILSISLLMAILFRSWRMVIISMVPNLIPLLFTAGIMGWFNIPLKPSTLIIFSIALGNSVDETIRFLAKYRQDLKTQKWSLKECVILSIRDSGLGIFYTSVILFAGFSVFSFSQFGGTQALGLLVSLTLFVAMITNLILLPSLLLTLDRLLTTKSFEEPYFEIFDEDSDIEWNDLKIEENGQETQEVKEVLE